ncbi:type III-A CRISPR-associated RAMP protein Csm5 [Microscilla marina]|uniref:CRISPR system Cms protein Csm5 n=1 Tax=Microscilla marina ATCC 23134 TaxID=313606 RepID=A1ZVA0_MICM2|nr:type III-A CRISPR-associated RAMP protein Csm5 [Microscilla marina]EAY25756.1 crispr-associated ramp protein, Csm5 family [Microscilla marina ATCC 23134]
MKLTLKTLTPLHIGNGEELSALDYVLHQRTYYRVSQYQFLEFIKNDEALVEAYAKWIDQTTRELDDLQDRKNREHDKNRKRDYNQQLSHLRKQFSLLSFMQIQGKEQELLEFLKRPEVLKTKLGESPKQQIRGHIKTANREFYVPGTSLKGAIRTALLYKYLENHQPNTFLSGLMQRKTAEARRNSRETKKISKNFADELEQRAFYCAGEVLRKKDGKIDKRLKHDDEKFDLLKLLLIADGRLPQPRWQVGNVNLYLVTKVRDRRTRKLELKADQQTQAPSIEYITANQTIESQLDFNIDFLWNLNQSGKLKTDDKTSWVEVTQGGETIRQWVGIREKAQQLFGIDLATLTEANKEATKTQVLTYIFESIQAMSTAQLKADNDWFAHFEQHDNTRNYDAYSKKMQQGRQALAHQGAMMRAGFGAGYNSTTEVLYLLSNDELKDAFRQMMQQFLIGDAPGAQNKRKKPGEMYEPNPDRFPKSRRMLTQKDVIAPLGWLALYPEGVEVSSLAIAAGIGEAPTKKVTENEGATAAYFKGTLNPKKRPEMDAVVTKTGTPNEVEVWVREDYKPTIKLDGYRSAIDEGKVLVVSVGVNKKKKVTQVSFVRFKG